MRLPIEIRHRIIKLLLGPLYTYCPETRQSRIDVWLEVPSTPNSYLDVPDISDLRVFESRYEREPYQLYTLLLGSLEEIETGASRSAPAPGLFFVAFIF